MDTELNVDQSLSNSARMYSKTKTYQTIGISALGLLVVFGAFAVGAVAEASAAKGSPSMFAAVLSAIVPTTPVSAVLAVGTDTPAAGTVQVSGSSQTAGIPLTTFTLAPKGADTTLHSVVVSIAARPTATSSVAVIHALKLYQGSTLLGSETLSLTSTSSAVKFSNLNVSIPANGIQSFRIVADINPLDGKIFVNGASVQATVSAANVDLETAGASCTNNSVAVSGTAAGNFIVFQNAGISVDATPTTSATATSVSGNTTQQQGTFTLTFNVTASGQDVYVPSTVSAFAPQQLFDQNGVATTTQAANISSTADRSPLNNYVIHAGQTKSFTITFTKLGQNGLVQAKLASLMYGSTDSSPASSSYALPNTYVTSMLMVKGVTTVSTTARGAGTNR